MFYRAIAALRSTLSPHLALSNSRVETMALLVIGMISARTVNLSHLASTRPTGVLVASTYRRFQRFFQHAELGRDWSAPLVARLLDLTGSWHLALDRTQWRVGNRDVNFLVLAAVTRRFRVPLVWSVLDHRGPSDTAQRIALMRRYLGLFDRSSIRLLLADREFVGAEWIEFLHRSDIPPRCPAPSACARMSGSSARPATTSPSQPISAGAAATASSAAGSPPAALRPRS